MLRQWHFLITAIVFGMLGWSSALYVSTFPAPFKKIYGTLFLYLLLVPGCGVRPF